MPPPSRAESSTSRSSRRTSCWAEGYLPGLRRLRAGAVRRTVRGSAGRWSVAGGSARQGGRGVPLGWQVEVVAARWASSKPIPTKATLAEDYVKAFERTDEVGLAAHQYAAFYAGNRYFGYSEEHSHEAGSIIARAYRESDQRDAQLRIKYASAYLLGYQHATPDARVRRPRHGPPVGGHVHRRVRVWLAPSHEQAMAERHRLGVPVRVALRPREDGLGLRRAGGLSACGSLLPRRLPGVPARSTTRDSGDDYYDYAWEYYLAYHERSFESSLERGALAHLRQRRTRSRGSTTHRRRTPRRMRGPTSAPTQRHAPTARARKRRTRPPRRLRRRRQPRRPYALVPASLLP